MTGGYPYPLSFSDMSLDHKLLLLYCAALAICSIADLSPIFQLLISAGGLIGAVAVAVANRRFERWTWERPKPLDWMLAVALALLVALFLATTTSHQRFPVGNGMIIWDALACAIASFGVAAALKLVRWTKAAFFADCGYTFTAAKFVPLDSGWRRLAHFIYLASAALLWCAFCVLLARSDSGDSAMDGWAMAISIAMALLVVGGLVLQFGLGVRALRIVDWTSKPSPEPAS